MRASNLLLALFLFAAPALAQAPHAPIVTAALALDAPKIEAQKPVTAAVTFTIPEHWHIYWQNPGDSGIPTTLAWQLPQGVTAGEIAWPAPSRLETSGIVNYGYSDHATLLVPLTPARNDISGDVAVKASWLACKDICIPESVTLTAHLPRQDANAAGVIAATEKLLPRPLPAGTQAAYGIQKDRVLLRLSGTAMPDRGGFDRAEFFPVEDGVVDDDAPQELAETSGQLVLNMKRGNSELPAEWHGVIELHSSEYITSYAIAAAKNASLTVPNETHAALSSLPLLLLFAFAGGLLLNLMPCVLPILSLKALALAKKAEASAHGARLQGLGYAAGVIGSFLLIACIMLALRGAGTAALGWGFQLQQPQFVTFLFLLMVMIALNLFGLFELPVLFGGLAARTNETKLLGSFLTGALAVAVATPCTAPFMAPALGATLTLAAAPALLIFAALGLGMASPFLLISFWPAARALLPKPGVWMVRFRQLLAFPMLATAAWLLVVLLQINGMGGVTLALVGAIGLAFLVWLASFLPGKRFMLALMLALASFIIAQQPAHERAGIESKSAAAMDGEPFSAARLAQLREAGRPVFVDATAAWCLTCKLNEHLALHDAAVARAFKEHHVAILVADWTNRDDAITTYLASFGRNGVPIYVFYPPHAEPVVLPQLLTPALVLDRTHLHED